jgi:flagellar protein FlbD
MIRLTRLNNQPLAVNSDLIKFVEEAPDTMLTLVTGEKIVVRENAQQVLDKIVEFRRSIAGEMAQQLNNAATVAQATAQPEKDESITDS